MIEISIKSYKITRSAAINSYKNWQKWIAKLIGVKLAYEYDFGIVFFLDKKHFLKPGDFIQFDNGLQTRVLLYDEEKNSYQGNLFSRCTQMPLFSFNSICIFSRTYSE
jgi:hypothetical protein